MPTTARASARVVGSGTVGPDPITAGSSPGTSEIASVATAAGIGAARQPPALDAGEMLAHGVDVADPGTGLEQSTVDGLLFGERQPGDRSNPVGRCPARHQHQHEIAGSRARGERQGAFRPGKARRIGDGMAGLDDLDDARRAAIAAPGHRHADDPRGGDAVEVMGLRDLGHGARGLSGGEDDEPAGRRRVRQMRHEAARGMRGRDGCSIKLGQEGARWIHE